MIKKLRRKTFWMLELLPLCVLFLFLIAYNNYYISYTLSDEKDVLEYCTSCIEKQTETVDEYLYLPTGELTKASDPSSHLNGKVKNLLYAVIASYIGVIKTDSDGNILEQTENCEDLTVSDIRHYTGGHGKYKWDLYSTVTKTNTRYIILLDTHDWVIDILRCLLISLLGLILAAFIFAGLALYLSKKIIRPVEEAMIKQSHFISDASHELKTPISVINANIEVLRRQYGENKWMGYIQEEGHKMNQLINELLSLSRLDHDLQEKKRVASPEPFQVYDAIMESVLPFDSVAFEKKVTITTECKEQLRSRGSQQDFQQILTILTDNAVTHVNENGEININAKHAKNTIRVTVSNTGSTLSEQDIPFIFERFYKAKFSGTSAVSDCKADSGKAMGKNQAGNFGLGLSIAKALCEKNDFEISAQSKNGIASFTVTIPELPS